jgi:hypothetical protein
MGVRCNGRLSDARQIIFAKSTNSITPPWEALIRNHYSSLLTQTFALLRTRTQQQLEAPILNRYHSLFYNKRHQQQHAFNDRTVKIDRWIIGV